MVSDFGLGKGMDAETSTLTLSHQAMGTLAYMAPEQFSDVKQVGKEADVYALGKILCEMFTGQAPAPLRVNVGDLPGDFRHFVTRCCEDDPNNRYPDAGEALAAFDVVMASSPTVDPPAKVAEQLAQEWMSTPEGPDLDVLRRLDQHLQRYSEEEEMYFELVPRLPQPLIKQYIDELPRCFRLDA